MTTLTFYHIHKFITGARNRAIDLHNNNFITDGQFIIIRTHLRHVHAW